MKYRSIRYGNFLRVRRRNRVLQRIRRSRRNSNRIPGCGLKNIYAFGPECKMFLKYVGPMNTFWYYGAGKYDNTFALKNILNVKEKPESDMLSFYVNSIENL